MITSFLLTFLACLLALVIWHLLPPPKAYIVLVVILIILLILILAGKGVLNL